MPHSTEIRLGSWLKTPFRCDLGSIKLAGALKDGQSIHPEKMRKLGSYALIFIQSGQGTYFDANAQQRTFGPGDAILIFPELAHAYGPQTTNLWTHIYIVFEGAQFDLLRDTDLLCPSQPVWHLGAVDYWKRRIEEACASESPQAEASAVRALGRFTNLLTDMAATHAEASRKPHEAWLGESMRLLSEPSSNGWLSPQETAQHVGLSYENFRKLFSKHVSESPASFQKNRRIEHACSMIYQDAFSFKELAEQYGFCDVFHFSKVFSQVMGESPSQYRKRIHGK